MKQYYKKVFVFRLVYSFAYPSFAAIHQEGCQKKITWQ